MQSAVRITLGMLYLVYGTSCTMAKTSLALDSFSSTSGFSADSIAGEDSLSDSGYVVIKGQCNSSIVGFEVSADLLTGSNNAWFPLSSAELPTGSETLPAAVIYDSNCSDGFYSVYFFRHNLVNWFTVDPANGDNNISKFYIRGILADQSTTTALTVYDKATSDFKTPVQAQIQKLAAPWNLIAQASCTPLLVRLIDANGKGAKSATAATVKLLRAANGASGAGDFYSDNQCITAISTGEFVFPANQFNQTIYLKTYSTIETNLSYYTKLNENSSVPMTLKIKSSSSKFVVYDGPARVVPDACYSVRVSLYDFFGPLAAPSGGVNFTLSGIPTYSNSTCTTPITGLTIPTSTYSTTIYAMWASSPTSIDTNVSTITSGVEGFSEHVQVASITNQVIAKARLEEEVSVPNYQSCQKYRLVLRNDQDQPIPNNTGSDLSLTLSPDINYGSVVAGVYSDATCTTRVTHLTISAAEFRSDFYFKADALGPLTLMFSSTTPAISSVPYLITISN